MRFTPAATLVLLFVSLGTARAQAATIVLVRPAGAAPELTETVSRLHGELLSLGLDVAFVDRAAGPPPDPADARARLEPIATARDADAVIEIGAAARATTVDIYVVDRRTHGSEAARVALESTAEDGPARLAIRTIEVLRSHLVEIDLAARARPGRIDVRTAPAAAPETRAPAAADRLGLEAGAALLTGVDGLGPALLPTARVGWATRSGLVLHAALAGLGSRPTLTAPAGSARVAQQFGLVGISTGAPSMEPRRYFHLYLQPYLALAAGALHTAVDGTADAPAEAHVVDRWSFLVDGSVGARVHLPGRAFFTLALNAQVAAPYVAIHIGDTRVATTGRPNLLLTLTVGAWL